MGTSDRSKHNVTGILDFYMNVHTTFGTFNYLLITINVLICLIYVKGDKICCLTVTVLLIIINNNLTLILITKIIIIILVYFNRAY